MSLWEYKVITSGKGGFATPAMLEKFLNDLGRDEWEIVEYHSTPDNMLAFSGLARRTTQRDWTLQDAAAAAAKAEAEKLRAEFAAKFEAATKTAPASAAGGDGSSASFLEEKASPDDGFRKPVDTSRDDDPEAHEEPKDDWDKLTASEEEELPVFFDAIKPHMRRNQRGAGMSVGTDYLAKKWDQAEEDIKGALIECGFIMPVDEDSRPEYVEYDGDLYWLNINRRGELWINTKEKPRPIFRNVKATRIEQPAEESKPEAAAPAADQPSAKPHFEPRARREEQPAAVAPATAAPTSGPADAAPQAPQAAAPAPDTSGPAFPTGADLLNKFRPHMRRNRRGPGGSGSATFLARALRRTEADLVAAFNSLGLVLPPNPNDKPIFVDFGNEVWWLNQDSRGGIWINGRDKKDGEVLPPPGSPAAPATDGSQPAAPATPPTDGSQPAAAAPADGTAAPASTGETIAAPSSSPESTPSAAPAPESSPAPAPAASSESASSTAPAEAAQVAASTAPVPVPTAPEYALSPTPAPEPAASAPTEQPAAPARSESSASNPVLSAVRLLLKETRTGALAGKLERVAEELSKSPDELTAALVGAGLKVPEKAKEKPVFVEQAGEIFWFNRNAKDELWINAKASKYADKPDSEEAEGEDADKKPARRTNGARSRKKDE